MVDSKEGEARGPNLLLGKVRPSDRQARSTTQLLIGSQSVVASSFPLFFDSALQTVSKIDICTMYSIDRVSMSGAYTNRPFFRNVGLDDHILTRTGQKSKAQLQIVWEIDPFSVANSALWLDPRP